MPKQDERTLRSLIDALGRDAAFALVNACGGQYRRVPRKPRAWVVAALGPTDAQRFCNHFRDTPMTIPKAEKWKRAERNRRIREDYDRHKLPIHELVTKYDLTAQRIHMILNAPDEPCDDYGFATVPYFPNGDDRTIDMFAGMQ